MNTIELEVQKASLAREILGETDETIIKKWKNSLDYELKYKTLYKYVR